MMFLNPLRNFAIFCVLLLSLGISSCGSVPSDGSTALSKQSQIDVANFALTTGDCKTANAALYPVYNSKYSDNSVRMTMASVYGCSAGINLLSTINAISQNAGLLSGAGFWGLLAKLFPSTFADVVPESGEYATDALFSVIYPGSVVAMSNISNFGGFNPGSAVATDRLPDANTYLVFTSMAAAGGIENRYGLPNPATYIKTQNFLWVKATTSGMQGDGCALSASILNLFDGINAISTNLAGNALTANLGTVYTAFNILLNQACSYGCQGVAAPYDAGFASGCSFSAAQCATCPITLRNRASCTQLTSDINSCAAAGIIDFLNKSPLGWN